MNARLLLLTLLLVTSCNSKLAELDRISPVDFFVKQFGLDAEPTPGQYVGHDSCNALAKDAQGNIYCAGWTTGDFAETNSGGANTDALVIKMDPKGNLIWATQLGATTVVAGGSNVNVDECEAIAVDPTGNVYCAGSTASDMAGLASNAGLRDGFVLKLNSAGAVVWVSLVGSTLDDSFTGLKFLTSGDLIAVGSTSGDVVPGEGVNLSDAFVTRMTSEGAVVWTRQLGQVTLPLLGRPALAGNDSDVISDVVIDRSGTISVGGSTRSSLGEANAGTRDIFLWRLNSAGTSLSIKQYGAALSPFTSGNDTLNDFIGDDAGNLYWSGGTTGSFADTNAGMKDAFIMKTNALGEILWKTQLGSTNLGPGGDNSLSDSCSNIALNKFSLYCSGTTNGSIGEAHTGGGDVNLFIIRVNPSTGAVEDWLQFGAETLFSNSSNFGGHIPYGIFADERDRLFVAGQTLGDFGEENADAANLTTDIFVFKLDDNHRPSTQYLK